MTDPIADLTAEELAEYNELMSEMPEVTEFDEEFEELSDDEVDAMQAEFREWFGLEN